MFWQPSDARRGLSVAGRLSNASFWPEFPDELNLTRAWASAMLDAHERMKIWPFIGSLLLATGALLLPACAAASPADTEFFEKKIRPVLADHCYECHSGTSKKLKGGLRVDSRAALLAGGDEGPALVPGKPEVSRLFRAMAHRDPDLAMPPKQPKLPETVAEDFETWIRNGALWPESAEKPVTAEAAAFNLEERKQKQAWLWQAPRKQAVPAVKNGRWPLDAVDFFILRRLEESGLEPAVATDDRTWLRRAHFAITGLPPSRKEIQKFLADREPGARARAVDGLLDSPHFGERWARHWMDLMRYAESRGHEGDYLIANAWQYRDYLIRAFNADVPYDQFLMEHIAGDLLPEPRFQPDSEANESILATGWAFLGEENHSPVDIRQDECERIDNKVDVFSKTFLGLTVACARCHDHKFDPIRAQDYYALSGFLLGSSYRQARFEAMENNRKMAAELAAFRAQAGPRLAGAIADAHAKGISQIAEYILAARDVVFNSTVERQIQHNGLDPARIRAWIAQFSEALTNQTSPLALLADAALRPEAPDLPSFAEWMAENRLPARAALDSGTRVIADYTKPGLTPWKVDGVAFGNEPLAAGDIIYGDDPANPIAGWMTYGAARRDLFWNRIKTAADNENDSGRLGATARAGQMLRTPTVKLETGKLHYLINGKCRVYAAVDSHLMNEGPLHGQLARSFASGLAPGPQWVTHDLTPYVGHRVHVEFGPEGAGVLEVLMVVEAPEPPRWRPAAVPFEPNPQVASIEDFARAFQAAVASANERIATGTLADSPDASRQAALANWIVRNPALFGDRPSDALARSQAEFASAQSNIAARVRWESRTAVALFDGTGVDEHVLVRGNPFKPGALSPRALPAAFPDARPITTPDSSGRLELARQLADPANPLVARVMVNRVWHHLFGRGIIATVDNFGALGERPTHPELLDHLAWQFVHEDGWSLKRLIRRLVLSRTFAMSSKAADPGAEESDPSNALLHRMPVRRLEGEAIRDALLAVSGRLNPTVGGKPEPLFLTEFLVGRGRPEKSGSLDGDGRRSVYMAMRRNFLPTLMATFDAPTPFSSVGRRNVTNVPGQSLALMNDPLFHQQARVLQERLFRELPGDEAAVRVQWLFESTYARLPSDAETRASIESLAEFRQLHESSENPNVEGWVELCHVLLNANEFIYVR